MKIILILRYLRNNMAQKVSTEDKFHLVGKSLQTCQIMGWTIVQTFFMIIFQNMNKFE